MLSLFDETKNPLFKTFCKIVTEVHGGAKLTRKDICNKIFSIPNFIYAESPEVDRENKIIDALFKFDSAGFAKICLDAEINLPPTDTELGFLKTLLLDEETQFLIPADLRQKLLSRLEKVPPLYDSKSWVKLRTRIKQPEGKIFADKLSVIVTALRLNKKIAADGKIITPCRLEYDMFADRYFLIALNDDCIKKIPVAEIAEIFLTAEPVPADAQLNLQKFYSSRAEISLLVRNTRNAVERCFALFGSFDKKSRLQDDGNYFLSISYCQFEEEEVVEKILSLGAAVTVLSPDHIRNQIIDNFKAIISK